ncbi:MAG: glutamate racemase [bacterium]|nr:glutamate racemase [bacterium]
MNERPIGVFDSGVGGLTVFKALEAALPDESMVYLGDTARVPYGTKSPETVARYAREAAHFLARQRVKLLVVACNSASSVGLEALTAEVDFPVVGVIRPGAKAAVELTDSGRIGVIGTRATIDSHAYTHAIRELRPDAEIVSQACPLFVPLAEEGWTHDDVTYRVAERYLTAFEGVEVDAVVLGCTHYPLLKDVIGQTLGSAVRLVDSAESVAAEVAAMLHGDSSLSAEGTPRTADHHFFVTDVPGPFQVVAERFLGRRIERLERASIEGE